MDVSAEQLFVRSLLCPILSITVGGGSYHHLKHQLQTLPQLHVHIVVGLRS